MKMNTKIKMNKPFHKNDKSDKMNKSQKLLLDVLYKEKIFVVCLGITHGEG